MEHVSLISHEGDMMSPYFSGPASCLFASLAIKNAPSEDSDQTAWMSKSMFSDIVAHLMLYILTEKVMIKLQMGSLSQDFAACI